jgi:hypothetical protein
MGLANGVPIADEAYYSLATIDFLADGGDGLSPELSDSSQETRIAELQSQ